MDNMEPGEIRRKMSVIDGEDHSCHPLNLRWEVVCLCDLRISGFATSQGPTWNNGMIFGQWTEVMVDGQRYIL